MSGVLGLLGVAVVLLGLLTGRDAIFSTDGLTTQILKPVRATADEVGLIFIPDRFIKGEQYTQTARAIQEASELRVWVALTGSYLLNVADSQQVARSAREAIQKLKNAGMKSRNYVGVGHGIGGHYLQEYARKSALKAVILLGSSLPRDTQLRDFPTPVLTLAAELDGLTRITRVAEEYAKLADDVLWNVLLGIYRTPVILLEGVNHAQFASGLMPPHVSLGDLAPNVTEEQAHLKVGEYVNHFLTATFSSEDSHIEQALRNLTAAFFQCVVKLQPFLVIKSLDTDGEESLWTILAQEHFAAEYGPRVGTYNMVLENPMFFTKQPTSFFAGDVLVLGTATLIHAEDKPNPLQNQMVKESPQELNMKLVSKDAMWKALASKNDTTLRSEANTCASLNRLGLELALALSGKTARERYETRGRPIIVEEDMMRTSNLVWAPTPLQMWEDEAGLHVKSVAMVTPITNFINAGAHYCKVMSPYRAMEWVNVDSLRPYSSQFN